MATALDIVTGALKLLGVTAAESPITDAEAVDGLQSLNDMMAEWEVENISIGYEEIDELDDILYVDDGMEGAIKANLAVYIAPEYDRVVSPSLEKRATSGKRMAQASSLSFDVKYPDSLPIGSGNEVTGTGNGDIPGSGKSGKFFPANSRNRCS